MLICIQVERSQKDGRNIYSVYDTDDHRSEDCRADDIIWAFKNGIQVFGLLHSSEGISIDKSVMYCEGRYRTEGGSLTKYLVWMLSVQEQMGYVCIRCNGGLQDYNRWRIFDDGRLIADIQGVPREMHHSTPSISGVISVTNNGKPLTAVGFSVYDKHFYAEDHGCSFEVPYLQYGCKDVAKGVMDMSLDYPYPWERLPTDAQQFEWCGQKVTLRG